MRRPLTFPTRGIDLARFVVAGALVLAAPRLRASEPGTPGVAPTGPSPDAIAAAQALFVEGRRLVADKHYEEGCAKLEQSKKLDPAPGTGVNLADCYEKSGRLAAAWLEFHEAAIVAQRSGRPEWAEQALSRAQRLEPRVPVLTVLVDEPSPEIAVLRDGVPMDPSTFGSPVPVDPGAHVVTAAAAGRRPWSTRVAVEPNTRVVLHVPPLVKDAPDVGRVEAQPSVSTSAPVEHRGTVQRAVAIGLGTAALVWLGAGAYFGAITIRDNNEAASRCPTSPQCTDPQAIVLTDEAQSAASASTAAFVGGGVVLAVAAGLFLTAPSDKARPALGVRLGATSMSLVGRW